METKGSKVLSSLSYWSIFFAPFILPILIWGFSNHPVSTHGKKALFYHIGALIFYLLGIGSFAYSKNTFHHPELIANIALTFSFIFLFIAFSLAIYNLVKGLILILQY